MNQLIADAAIDRWKRAYKRANGKSAPEVIYKGSGWYRIQGDGTNIRTSKFDEYSERLELRALERASINNPKG